MIKPDKWSDKLNVVPGSLSLEMWWGFLDKQAQQFEFRQRVIDMNDLGRELLESRITISHQNQILFQGTLRDFVTLQLQWELASIFDQKRLTEPKP